MTTLKTERLDIRSSDDVVRVRQLTRTMALTAGLGLVDQTKIITAASELARNTLDYGGGGFADGAHQFLGFDIFGKVRGGAGAQHPHHARFVCGCGEGDDLHRGRALQNAARGFDARGSEGLLRQPGRGQGRGKSPRTGTYLLVSVTGYSTSKLRRNASTNCRATDFEAE